MCDNSEIDKEGKYGRLRGEGILYSLCMFQCGIHGPCVCVCVCVCVCMACVLTKSCMLEYLLRDITEDFQHWCMMLIYKLPVVVLLLWQESGGDWRIEEEAREVQISRVDGL